MKIYKIKAKQKYINVNLPNGFTVKIVLPKDGNITADDFQKIDKLIKTYTGLKTDSHRFVVHKIELHPCDDPKEPISQDLKDLKQ